MRKTVVDDWREIGGRPRTRARKVPSPLAKQLPCGEVPALPGPTSSVPTGNAKAVDFLLSIPRPPTAAHRLFNKRNARLYFSFMLNDFFVAEAQAGVLLAIQPKRLHTLLSLFCRHALEPNGKTMWWTTYMYQCYSPWRAEDMKKHDQLCPKPELSTVCSREDGQSCTLSSLSVSVASSKTTITVFISWR